MIFLKILILILLKTFLLKEKNQYLMSVVFDLTHFLRYQVGNVFALFVLLILLLPFPRFLILLFLPVPSLFFVQILVIFFLLFPPLPPNPHLLHLNLI